MDAISYGLASKQAQRIKKFIENPDSVSGVLTQPSVIQAGETVTVPTGRTAILANTQIDGTLTVDGTVFIPSGATTTDIDTKLSTKVDKVTSTDNAVVRFDGTTGAVQNSNVFITDDSKFGVDTSTPLHKISAYKATGWNTGVGAQSGNRFIQLSADSNSGTDVFWDSSSPLKFSTGSSSDATGYTERMRIASNGNLLVGTTTDNGVDKLQVNGSIISKSSQWKYTDLNNASVVNEQTLVRDDCLNIPYNDYGYVTISVSTAYTYCMQTFVGLNAPVRLFIRVMSGGNWSAWVEK